MLLNDHKDIIVASVNWSVFALMTSIFFTIKYKIHKIKPSKNLKQILTGSAYGFLGFGLDRGYWAIQRTLEALSFDNLANLMSAENLGILAVIPRLIGLYGACLVIEMILFNGTAKYHAVLKSLGLMIAVLATFMGIIIIHH